VLSPPPPPPTRRYAERQVQRQLSSQRVKLPSSWEREFAKHANDGSREPQVGVTQWLRVVS
jgi:hypothetical protein